MKTIRAISIVLLLFVGINALIAGYLFMADPSGAELRISLSSLQYSPFKDFLIPGIILFIVNGVLNILAAACTIWKMKNYPGMIALQGVLLTGWIVVQILMMQDIFFLHYILGSIGILLFMFGNRLNV